MLNKPKIELIELSNQVTVPSIEGRYFCSRRDPLQEAQKWFESVERSCQGQSEILVLGLGAGFHLLPLFELGSQIFVFEAEPLLKEAWPLKGKLQFVDSDIQTKALVLEFRPAWAGNDNAYLQASRKFRGSDVQSLKDQAENQDLWILAQSLEKSQWPENFEISIKEIAEMIPKENQTEEARMWRALRELVL